MLKIGCIILEDVFFLDKWIEEPANWGKSIVSGKKYSTDTEIGAELFHQVNVSINGKTKTDEEIIEEIENDVNALSIKGEERIALVKNKGKPKCFQRSFV